MKAILTVLALALISFNTWAIDATHGMVLFGSEKLMAYHLPMFHNIHAYQVVLEYTVPEEIKNKLQSYQDADFLTFVPAPFDLEKFLAKPFPLKGDVYKGHFEKDGELVMSDITMENVKVLFSSGITKKEGTQDLYRLFGTPTDLYSVHLLYYGIEKDHILKVSIDTTVPEQIKLASIALNAGYKIANNTGLLIDGGHSQVGISFGIPRYGTLYRYLEITNDTTIFSDDVM